MTTPLRSVTPPPADPRDGSIALTGATITIHGLVVVDADLAALLNRAPVDEHPAIVRRALAVGARGLATMGVGVDLQAIDERVRETLGRLTDDAERRLGDVLADGRRAMTEAFDPEHRSSLMARVVGELASLRDGFLGRIDPEAADSHTNAFLARLATVIGPDGAIEQRILDALDPRTEGSALGELAATVDARLADLRDLIVHGQGVAAGRAAEAARGTAQGVEFEDEVEVTLRTWAAGAGGCVIERTGRTTGSLGAQAAVGDFVVTLPEGRRIVVEAKNQATLALTGANGILGELDRAIANRSADAAVCVSRRDAFPAEVGGFGVYGNKVLVVDDGDGVMTAVALRWVRAMVAATAAGREQRIDLAVIADRVAAIRRTAESLKGARTSLTAIKSGVEGLHDRLGELRHDLLDQVADIERELAAG